MIEAENVEIQRGDGPDIKCVVKKTVLGELDKDQDLSADFDGIELVVRKSSGKEMFGFYKDVANRPDLKHQFDQFPFKPFLDREFTVITLKGLSYEDGNRQISVDARNELGSGTSSSQWRRHAKLSLTVPKCQGVAIQGGLGGLLRSLARRPAHDSGNRCAGLSHAIPSHRLEWVAHRLRHPAARHRRV